MSCTKLGKEVKQIGSGKSVEPGRWNRESGVYVQDAFKASFWCKHWHHAVSRHIGSRCVHHGNLKAALCKSF